MNGKSSEREKNYEIVLTIKTKLRAVEGRWVGE